MHITKKDEFSYLYKHAYKVVTGCFVLFVERNMCSEKKVAVVASKKIGKAVERNRVKRRMRELLRLSKYSIENGSKIIIVARKALLTAKFEDLRVSFLKVLNNVYSYEKSK